MVDRSRLSYHRSKKSIRFMELSKSHLKTQSTSEEHHSVPLDGLSREPVGSLVLPYLLAGTCWNWSWRMNRVAPYAKSRSVPGTTSASSGRWSNQAAASTPASSTVAASRSAK